MGKSLKVEIPMGYEIDEERSTFTNIVFKEINKTQPKTWEQFCDTHCLKAEECWANTISIIINAGEQGYISRKRRYNLDKTILPNLKQAKAMVALCQLIQLRDCYNDGWEPDYENRHEIKHVIEVFENKIQRAFYTSYSHILAFKDEELRDMFLNNFRDLIEIAKPLL